MDAEALPSVGLTILDASTIVDLQHVQQIQGARVYEQQVITVLRATPIANSVDETTRQDLAHYLRCNPVICCQYKSYFPIFPNLICSCITPFVYLSQMSERVNFCGFYVSLCSYFFIVLVVTLLSFGLSSLSPYIILWFFTFWLTWTLLDKIRLKLQIVSDPIADCFNSCWCTSLTMARAGKALFGGNPDNDECKVIDFESTQFDLNYKDDQTRVQPSSSNDEHI